MRILMVLDRDFPPDLRVENEISTLINEGHKIILACYTRYNLPLHEKEGNLTIYRERISSFIYKSGAACLTLPFYFRFWKRFLFKICETEKPDVIHIHDLPLAKTGIQLKQHLNTTLTLDLHENWPALVKVSKHTNTLAGKIFSPIWLWRNYENKVLKYVDNIIVVVSEAKERIINLKVPGKKIHVVSNTINLDLPGFTVNVKKKNFYELFYGGGITYHRGLQNVIKAIYKSGRKDIIFKIAGDGNYTVNLKRLVSSLALGEIVVFTGKLPYIKMMEILAESDFAIIPHLRNEHTDSTIPHKLFQYMFLQKAVIASDCRPIKRIIEETGAGIIYPSENIDELTAIINSLDYFAGIDMGFKGRKAVLEKYNWNIDGKNLLEIYSS